MSKSPSLLFIFTTLLILWSCKRKNDDFQPDTPKNYFNLQPGKFITYKLDSTVFLQQGRVTAVHHYQEKDVIDSLITDLQGRPGYRVYRYVRDSAGLLAWTPTGTYSITPVNNNVEVTDEYNLRMIKLISPITEGTTWKGNSYLSLEPYASAYSFSNDDNMSDWDFTISKTAETVSLNGKTYIDVVTVKQIDEAVNAPVAVDTAYGSRSLSIEKYSKNIGLIYQDYILWEYQPNPGGTPYYVGFGIERSILDHN